MSEIMWAKNCSKTEPQFKRFDYNRFYTFLTFSYFFTMHFDAHLLLNATVVDYNYNHKS